MPTNKPSADETRLRQLLREGQCAEPDDVEEPAAKAEISQAWFTVAWVVIGCLLAYFTGFAGGGGMRMMDALGY